MKDMLIGEQLVALWREGGQDNPAGPLFAAGAFAEADITTADCCNTTVTNCGTQCSGSCTRECC